MKFKIKVLSLSVLIILLLSGTALTTYAEKITAEPTTTDQTSSVQESTTAEDIKNKIQIAKARVTLGVGESYSPELLFSDNALSKDITLTSSKSDTISVVRRLTLKAQKEGKAYISVLYENELIGKITLTVVKAPDSFTLNKTNLKIGLGESFKLKVSLPKGTASNQITYHSSNTELLTCSPEGLLTAKAKGNCTVTVNTHNGTTAKCKVTILNAPKKISLNKTELTLGIGESFNFNSSLSDDSASAYILYKSSAPEILTYSKSGVFTAKKKGTATVSVTTFNGKKATCSVTVLPAPKNIYLNAKSITLGVGESFNFNSSLPEGTASNYIKFTSANPKILTYSKSGIFTAKKAGTTSVSVTAFNGKKATCTVKILPAPKNIKCEEESYTIPIGSTKKVGFVLPKDTACNTYSFKSSDKSVAYCDSSGYIHAKKMGTVTITATSYNKKKCTFTVKVRAMNVPFVSQVPKYPTGCEGASVASLLQYYGYRVSLDEAIEAIPRKSIYIKNGKRWGPSINEYFVGNPKGGYTSKDPGYGAFSPCVVKAVNKLIAEEKGKDKAIKISGCSFETLLGYISEGHPAIVWATYMMQVPKTVNSWYITETGKYFEYPRGTHVMVLVGHSENTVTIIDPYKGSVAFNKDTFQSRWNLLGKQAIIIK